MNSQYKIKITGKNNSYFLHEIIKKKINIYDLKKYDSYIVILIDAIQYSKLMEIKTSYKIEIIDRIGFCKFKYLFFNNIIFIIFLIMGVFINIFLSNIIFDVEVVHSNKNIRNIIYSDLKYYGIKKYNFKVSYNDKERIVKEILNKEKENLEWMEIEEIGTKYVVKVEQRKKNSKEEFCKNRNIVASREAMIMEINATSGEVVKKKYDYVKKGDVLISGIIHNKEDIVSMKCAAGEVFGEVWYKVLVSLPIDYKEEKITNNSNYGIEVKFLNNEYNIFNKYKNFNKKKFNIINNNLLPINISFVKYIELEVFDKKYNINNSSSDALNIASLKIKSKLGENEEVLSKKVLKKERKESKIEVEVFVKVKENITSYQEIDNILEKEEKKEE